MQHCVQKLDFKRRLEDELCRSLCVLAARRATYQRAIFDHFRYDQYFNRPMQHVECRKIALQFAHLRTNSVIQVFSLLFVTHMTCRPACILFKSFISVVF